MARATVQQIARSKTSLSESQISSMSPQALWSEIYRRQPDKQPKDERETYFPTGFSEPEKLELDAEAEALGLRKTSDVNGLTDIVVTGDNPGRGRLEKAAVHDCKIMTCAQFLAYARHGILEVSDAEARSIIEK